MMIPPALIAQSVVFAREQHRVLDRVYLGLSPGELVAIEGPSGAGKSTLLQVLAGLLRPEHGRVIVAGYELSRLTPNERAQRLAIATQSPVLPADLTVIELVRLGRLPYELPARKFIDRMRRRDTPDSGAVEQAMVALGIRTLAARTLGSLSGGERRRAHLARVLAQDTPLVLLDEPTTHLDEVAARQLFEELRRRAEQGTAVIVVTHDLAWVHRCCDRRLRLTDGKLVPVPQRQDKEYTVAKTRDDYVELKIASMEELDR